MYSDYLREMEDIGRNIGLHPEFVQGGGGNISVKVSSSLMFIKASGFRLNDIKCNDGLVFVKYCEIRKYYQQKVNSVVGANLESEAQKLVSDFTEQLPGKNGLRASIEAGFHSLFGKYVIHTHSVYINIINCSKEGWELLPEIFKDSEYLFMGVPYASPGFNLTKIVHYYLERFKTQNGKIPDIIFLQNHGLIVNSDRLESCLYLHDYVNDKIKRYFKLSDSYPLPVISKISENRFLSTTNMGPIPHIDLGFFNKNVIFPDQVVYGENSNKKILMEEGAYCYQTTEKEASAIEELLLSYNFIVDSIRELGFLLNTLSFADIDYINNMDSEKYRKGLLAKK